MEPERLRNPRRGTCSRTRRGKPQVPQEEAQKQTPARGTTNAYPAQSRRREGRQLHRTTMHPHRKTPDHAGTIRGRLAAKSRKASHRRQWPKRRTGRRSEKATPPAQPGNSSASAKIPQSRTEFPKTSEKPRIWGKNRNLGNTAQGIDKILRIYLPRNQRRRHRNKDRTKTNPRIKTNKRTAREAIREASQPRRGRSVSRHRRS